MASGLLFQVVFIVTMMMFSKMTVSEADPLSDTTSNKQQHRCFFDPFLQFLDEMNLRFLGYILRRLLCPALTTINPVEETCPKPVDWNQPKMYVSYTYEEFGKSSIGSLQLVNGKYELGEGDQLRADNYLSYFTVDKAGNKIYATEDTNITIYTRNPCSYKFEKTHTEFIGPNGFLFILDPSEKYLIVGLNDSTAITSYRLEDDGTMSELGFIVPQNEPADNITGLAFNTKFNLVAAAKFKSNQIKLFNFDSDTGKLTTLNTTLSLIASDGVLDLVFSSGGMFLYVMGSYDMIIFQAKFNDDMLTDFEIAQQISFFGPMIEIDKMSHGFLKMHPNGTYLYSLYFSNKKISIFNIDSANGKLAIIQFQAFDDRITSFAITAKGDQIIVPNTNQKRIAVFNISGNGMITKDYDIVTEDKYPGIIV